MRLEGKNAAEGGETGNLDIHGDLTEHRPAAGQADMRVFYGFDALPHFVRPTVTVGSYDGVHSGHLALLRTVAGRAASAPTTPSSSCRPQGRTKSASAAGRQG